MHCEAKPVIDHYRLRKSKHRHAFDLYRNDEIVCVVSGIGGNNMSEAVTWATTQFETPRHRCWINLGIAGHKNLTTGTTLLARTVSSLTETEVFTPELPFEHVFPDHEIISFTEEQEHYPEHAACDMEAFDFVQSVFRRDSAHNYCCIKVISDNTETPAHRSKPRTSALIARNMPAIAQFADHYHTHVKLNS
jgi:hypothetical protein